MNKGHLIDYARVSAEGQDLERQRTYLKELGCTRIFEEKISGAKRDRPELNRMLDHLREDDVEVVTRLHRLARSTAELLQSAEQLRVVGAGLQSQAEPWADTTSPAVKMILTVFAGIADFERSLILERTGVGTAAPKTRGVKFGPKYSLAPKQIEHARQLSEEGMPFAENLRLVSCASFDAVPGADCYRIAVSRFIQANRKSVLSPIEERYLSACIPAQWYRPIFDRANAATGESHLSHYGNRGEPRIYPWWGLCQYAGFATNAVASPFPQDPVGRAFSEWWRALLSKMLTGISK